MGVYVFKCIHAPFIKVGHHKVCKTRPNAYYRVAGRGFQSCVHPEILDGRLYIQDLVLLGWFPSLTLQDEKQIHSMFKEGSIGEFHRESDGDQVLSECEKRGPSVEISDKERLRAISWGYRQIRKAKRKRKRTQIT